MRAEPYPEAGPPTASAEERRFLESFVSDAPDEALELCEEVYDRLRELADRLLAGERIDHTLQATALVHEAWVRLAGSENEADWHDAEHFFATAARALRRVLVDHARGKGRAKRGGGWGRVPLDPDAGAMGGATNDDSLDLDPLVLDRALEELEAESPRQARLVELRWFSGLSVEATAKVLGVSEGTIARDWRFARAWLARRLREPGS